MDDREEALQFAEQVEASLRKLGARPIDAVARMIQVRDERIRSVARAAALREAAKRDIAGEVWDLLVEHLDPADRRRGITSIYEAMREKFPRPAILADHTPDAGKRAEDFKTVRKALLYYNEHALSMDKHLTDNALAALDRIIGKEE